MFHFSHKRHHDAIDMETWFFKVWTEFWGICLIWFDSNVYIQADKVMDSGSITLLHDGNFLKIRNPNENGVRKMRQKKHKKVLSF